LLSYLAHEIVLEILRSVFIILCSKISCTDAVSIEFARKLDCRDVLSEDLNAGQNYGGVRAVNPF
jgi:hypothetical protein